MAPRIRTRGTGILGRHSQTPFQAASASYQMVTNSVEFASWPSAGTWSEISTARSELGPRSLGRFKSFQRANTANSFAYHVAQYHLLSLNALMTKLAQFPRGTKFIWTVPFPRGASEADKIFIEVPRFAADHGLQLERAPAPASGAD